MFHFRREKFPFLPCGYPRGRISLKGGINHAAITSRKRQKTPGRAQGIGGPKRPPPRASGRGQGPGLPVPLLRTREGRDGSQDHHGREPPGVHAPALESGGIEEVCREGLNLITLRNKRILRRKPTGKGFL